MNFHTQRKPNKGLAVAAINVSGHTQTRMSFADNRNESLVQRKIQNLADVSNRAREVVQLQNIIHTNSTTTVQKKENKTGLPDQLKSGVEQLSGLSMDDVKVHYNSSQPAQLRAHAFAQGTNIHIAPGQEKHLPHEAWHVVQQKQGRVKPTLQMKGKVQVNDDKSLEQEADAMGAKALTHNSNHVVQHKLLSPGFSENIIQSKWIDLGKELQWSEPLDGVVWFYINDGDKKGEMYYKIVDIKEVKLADKDATARFEKTPKPREFWVANSAFGDIYRDLDARVITPQQAQQERPQHSMTEAFLRTYPQEIYGLIGKEKKMTSILSQIIASERHYSGGYFVFYHALAKTALVLLEYNKAKEKYGIEKPHILHYLRSPELFADPKKPQTSEDAAKELNSQVADHGPIKNHLIALSTSLFSNFSDKGESTLHLFMTNNNITEPWKDIIGKKLSTKIPLFQQRDFWKAFNSIKAKGSSGELLQIAIPHDIADRIVMATTAGGTPMNMAISKALTRGTEKVNTAKGDEHAQARLLLTSDMTQKVMDQIIVNRFSFGQIANFQLLVDDLVKQIP